MELYSFAKKYNVVSPFIEFLKEALNHFNNTGTFMNFDEQRTLRFNDLTYEVVASVIANSQDTIIVKIFYKHEDDDENEAIEETQEYEMDDDHTQDLIEAIELVDHIKPIRKAKSRHMKY